MAKAKKDKVKIPKTVAGVKIPKELRKAASGAIAKLSQHPAISDIIASGLFAAAAALTEDKTVKKQDKSPREEAGAVAEQAAREANRAKVVVKAAAGAMGKALLDEIKATKATRPRKAAKGKGHGNGGSSTRP